MAGFDASKAVPRLDYDFRKYNAGHGTIPEPSDEILATYTREMAEFAKENDLVLTEENATSALEAAMNLSDSEFIEIQERVADITSRLTQKQPSAEEIMALPPRVRRAFFGWLQGMINPEA